MERAGELTNKLCEALRYFEDFVPSNEDKNAPEFNLFNPDAFNLAERIHDNSNQQNNN